MAMLTAFLASVSPGGMRRMKLWLVSVRTMVSPLSLFRLTWLAEASTAVTVPVRRAGAAVWAETPETLQAASINRAKAYFMEYQPKRRNLKLKGRPFLSDGYTPEKNGTPAKALEMGGL